MRDRSLLFTIISLSLLTLGLTKLFIYWGSCTKDYKIMIQGPLWAVCIDRATYNLREETT